MDLIIAISFENDSEMKIKAEVARRIDTNKFELKYTLDGENISPTIQSSRNLYTKGKDGKFYPLTK